MARIQFSTMMEEIIGKLAGSVFQDSYIGLQIRTRVTPRNPQTNYQQLRRGEFGYLAGSWRDLTLIQKDTWIVEAGSTPQAVRLFVQQNINLTLIEQPLILSHVSAPIPPAFPLNATFINPSGFLIQAASDLKIVPAGQSLLFYSTYQKAVTKIFTNPSEYSPVTTFPAGTDLTNPVEVIVPWNARYGQLLLNKRLCIKTVIIDNASGYRSPDYVSCYVVPIIEGNFLIDSDGTLIQDADSSLIIWQIADSSYAHLKDDTTNIIVDEVGNYVTAFIPPPPEPNHLIDDAGNKLVTETGNNISYFST